MQSTVAKSSLYLPQTCLALKCPKIAFHNFACHSVASAAKVLFSNPARQCLRRYRKQMACPNRTHSNKSKIMSVQNGKLLHGCSNLSGTSRHPLKYSLDKLFRSVISGFWACHQLLKYISKKFFKGSWSYMLWASNCSGICLHTLLWDVH